VCGVCVLFMYVVWCGVWCGVWCVVWLTRVFKLALIGANWREERN
jgi:hypothetical protein